MTGQRLRKSIGRRGLAGVAGAGLVLATTLGVALTSTSSVASAASKIPGYELGTFVPYWQNVEPYPTGCSGPVTPGFAVSASAQCGTDSNGNGLVDFRYLFGGASFSYTYTVPKGTVAYISYGIASAFELGNGPQSFSGGYLNNSPAKVSVNGKYEGTFSAELGINGAECQTIAACIIWKSAALTPGKHTVKVTAVHDDINLYGVWVSDQKV
jgi:hypothetical protein